MKLNKTILPMVILILLSSLVVAECPPECGETEFDYNTGNYENLDWDNFNDWSKIPPNRVPEIPADKLDYSQLNSVQRLEMTVEQISSHLSKIDNLAADVKEDRAREAIKQNYQVTIVSLSSNAKIVDNVLHAEFGERDSFDLNGKPAWKLEVGDDGKIRVLEPEEIIEQKISSQDSFTLVAETRFTSTGGSVNTVQHLSFKNGQAYVREGDSAKIGDYEIPAESNPVDVYFDPTTKPTGNYVSISENGLDISTTPGKTIKIIPQAGNRLFNMVKRDYSTDPPTLVPSEKDTLEITVSNGDDLEVISRANSGKTPLFRHHDEKGETKIKTGRMNFIIKEGNLKVDSLKPFSEGREPIDITNSVAFELVSDSDNFKGTFRTSSSNRFIVLQNEKQIVGNNLGLEVSDLIEDNMMKSIFDLGKKYPNIIFNFYAPALMEKSYDLEGIPGEYTDITANMAQYTNQLLQEQPGVADNLHVISFHTLPYTEGGFGNLEIGERSLEAENFLVQPTRNLNGPLDFTPKEVIVWPLFVEAFQHQLDKTGDISPEDLDKLQPGVDYGVKVKEGRSNLIIIAPHAGIIEPGTEILAEQIAGDQHSLYTFESYRQHCNDEGCRSHHITSTEFREPQLMELFEQKQPETAVAIHAFGSLAKEEGGETVDKVIVGGLNPELRDLIAFELEQIGIPVEVRAKGRFSGVDEGNVVNIPPGKGVQLEVSRHLMRQMYLISGQEGEFKLTATPLSRSFSSAVERGISRYEQKKKLYAIK